MKLSLLKCLSYTNTEKFLHDLWHAPDHQEAYDFDDLLQRIEDDIFLNA